MRLPDSVLLYTISIVAAVAALGCRDRDGGLLDWFVIRKFPQNARQLFGCPIENDGLYYSHITSRNGDGTWSNPERIRNTNSPLSQTTQQGIGSNYRYIAYNDGEAENVVDPEYEVEISNSSALVENINAHAKGFMWYDESDGSGIWVIHSVPKYKPTPDNVYSQYYPNNGKTYGQIMMCISFKGESDKKIILGHIYFMNAMVRANNFAEQYANFSIRTRAYYTLRQNFGGYQLLSKQHYRGVGASMADVYELVREGRDMRVSTYGPKISPGYPHGLQGDTRCGGRNGNGNPLTAHDVQQVLITTANESQFVWTTCTSRPDLLTRQDHSKWATMGTTTFCIGDMNRELRQTERSGGVVCVDNYILYNAFFSTIQIL